LKISIITVCFNANKTIEQTIISVLSQTYQNIEYIIIDGGSVDGTIGIIHKYSSNIDKIISEKDNGMYDALNKGIKLATGDIIGILNSDDFFSNNNILNLIVSKFNENLELDAIIGDVAFVNKTNKIIRHCSTKKWDISKFKFGNMPPHPSFYCKKYCYDKFGYYNTKYKIAGDFELLLRFFYINKLQFLHIPKILVSMKPGGLSTSGVKSTLTINREILDAFKINGLKTNFLFLYSRYFKKILEYNFRYFSI
jgi:glycosyltransferase involved in cell wall biosynthesis